MMIGMTLQIKDADMVGLHALRIINLHGPDMEVDVVAVQVIGDVTPQPGPSLINKSSTLNVVGRSRF